MYFPLCQGRGKGEGDSCWFLAPTSGKLTWAVGAAHFGRKGATYQLNDDVSTG